MCLTLLCFQLLCLSLISPVVLLEDRPNRPRRRNRSPNENTTRTRDEAVFRYGKPLAEANYSSHLKSPTWLREYSITKPSLSSSNIIVDGKLHQKLVSFTALGMDFKIRLRRIRESFHPKFIISLGDEEILKSAREDIIGRVGMYAGECMNSEKCRVIGKIDFLQDRFEGQIITREDTFYIENCAHYFSRNSSSSNTNCSIVYRKSDIIRIYDEEMRLVSPPNVRHFDNSIHQRCHRTKREENKPTNRMKTACTVFFVADHIFFEVIGEHSIANVVNEIRYHAFIADTALLSTDFNTDGNADNVGIIIAGIKIFKTASDNDNKFQNFYATDPVKYLERMRLYNWSNYCLAYVFTARDFNSVMGVAFRRKGITSGGICSKMINTQLGSLCYNIGLVSLVRWKQTSRQDLATIFLHELGHSFGSPHDDEGSACSPGGSNGNYIMYPYVLDASKPNRLKFSPCSINYMNPIITKHAPCLRSEPMSFCGDSVVDYGEDCDCGDNVDCLRINDTCCTPSDSTGSEDKPCKFKKSEGKVCSPLTSACCNARCQFISATPPRECREETECTFSAQCSGLSETCPEPLPKPDGMLCGGGRVCQKGLCSVSICTWNSLPECQCIANSTDFCHVCCWTTNGVCSPFYYKETASYIRRRVGDPCYNSCGTCNEQGACVKRKPIETESILKELEKPFEVSAIAWTKQYWYYIVFSLFVLTVASVVSVLTYRKHKHLETKTYQVGRLNKIMGEIELFRSKEMLKMQNFEQIINWKIERIRGGRRERDYPEAVARLKLLFPTVSVGNLCRTVSNCSSEVIAVRILIIRGYPLKSLFKIPDK